VTMAEIENLHANVVDKPILMGIGLKGSVG
jgi:hypothetical protein